MSLIVSITFFLRKETFESQWSSFTVEKQFKTVYLRLGKPFIEKNTCAIYRHVFISYKSCTSIPARYNNSIISSKSSYDVTFIENILHVLCSIAIITQINNKINLMIRSSWLKTYYVSHNVAVRYDCDVHWNILCFENVSVNEGC